MSLRAFRCLRRILCNMALAAAMAGAGGVAVSGCARTRPLVQPSPLRSSAEPNAVRQAILAGMQARGWRLQGESNGVITAGLEIRKHRVVINIHHAHDSVYFEYVSSEGLGAHKDANGTVHIHPKYRNWTQNLMASINKNLIAQLR